jgi:hypothetical protein
MDLSRDVLQRSTAFLSVIRVPPCGWSDLGTPDRLHRFLERPPRRPEHEPPLSHLAVA